MKKAVGVVAALVTGMTLVQGPPASAAETCTVYGLAYSTKTNAYGSSVCPVQARIDRYVSSVVKTYLGSWGSFSTVSNSSGVNAGNAYRYQSGGGTSPWVWL
jgi:hypothetical protein